jgi:hypothetical protein
MFSIVFRALSAIFIYVFLKSSMIFLVSFPLYVKVALYFRCCWSMYVFLFCGAGSILTFLYNDCYAICFIMFRSFSFVSLDTEHVFTK